MDYISFIFKEFGSSEIVFIILTISIIFLYNKFICPPIEEYNELKKHYKAKIDDFATKDDIKNLVTNVDCTGEINITVNNIIEKFTSLFEDNNENLESVKTSLKEEIIKLEELLKNLKEDIFIHHEELGNVKKISEEIKKITLTLYENTEKTLLQLESKGILDKFDRISSNDLNKIQISANELTVLASILSEVIDKSKPARKLDRI